ncbi:MAG: hypothetical protein V7609_2124 [Verrucomicrobiota bacterium]
MKFFIGAKNLSGQVIVAEMIEAKDFYAALLELQLRAQKIVGPGTVGAHPKFKPTAINEQIEFYDTRFANRDRPAVAEFLEGGR